MGDRANGEPPPGSNLPSGDCICGRVCIEVNAAWYHVSSPFPSRTLRVGSVCCISYIEGEREVVIQIHRGWIEFLVTLKSCGGLGWNGIPENSVEFERPFLNIGNFEILFFLGRQCRKGTKWKVRSGWWCICWRVVGV